MYLSFKNNSLSICVVKLSKEKQEKIIFLSNQKSGDAWTREDFMDDQDLSFYLDTLQPNLPKVEPYLKYTPGPKLFRKNLLVAVMLLLVLSFLNSG